MSYQHGTSKTHASDDITPPTIYFEEEVGALEGAFIGDVPTKTSLILPSCCSLQEENLQARGNRGSQNEDSKTNRIIVESHPPP